MSELTTEEKRKICARLFYQDNQDGEDAYEDYHEARQLLASTGGERD